MIEFGIALLVLIGVLIAIILLGLGMYSASMGVLYYNYDAQQYIYLDDKLIYSGPGRQVNFNQMGDVGNKYVVEIYKPGFWSFIFGKVNECYVGDNLIVKNKEEKMPKRKSCETCRYYGLHEMIISGKPYCHTGDMPCFDCKRYNFRKDNYESLMKEEKDEN